MPTELNRSSVDRSLRAKVLTKTNPGAAGGQFPPFSLAIEFQSGRGANACDRHKDDVQTQGVEIQEGVPAYRSKGVGIDRMGKGWFDNRGSSL